MATIKIVSGDISRVAADVLITAINSGGMWFGGIDGVINRTAGNVFHSQASEAMPLSDGQTVVAKGEARVSRGEFKNVVFVVDDLQRPLREIVYNGLRAASDAGFAKISVPMIRMGVMLGAVEKSAEEAVSEMVSGVRRFLAEHPKTSVESITFVVYNDGRTQSLLEGALKMR